MRFFYQHIGADLFARDAPVSLGSPGAERRFSLQEAQTTGRFMEDDKGIQIWGLPSGAASVCKSMDAGDYLLLLESDDFRYVGKIVYRWPDFREDLSSSMWGEGKFSIIVALEGSFVRFPWAQFKSRFGFRDAYHMRGNTMSLSADRIRSAGFEDAQSVYSWIVNDYGEMLK